MKLQPQFVTCFPEKMYSLGVYEGFLLSRIKSLGSIQYLYIFSVFQDKNPVFHFTAEESVASDDLFLGFFADDKHSNLGVDDRCRDQVTFLSTALNYVSDRFSLDMSSVQEVTKQRASDLFPKG